MEIGERYKEFTGAITALCHQVQVLKAMALEDFGIRGSNANCLFFLNQNREGLTVSELSGLCGQDKAAISRSLSELEDAGMVRVLLENGKRYRARFILTEAGLKVARKLWNAIEACVVAGGELLTEEERAVFYTCLKKIQNSLEILTHSKKQWES